MIWHYIQHFVVIFPVNYKVLHAAFVQQDNLTPFKINYITWRGHPGDGFFIFGHNAIHHRVQCCKRGSSIDYIWIYSVTFTVGQHLAVKGGCPDGAGPDFWSYHNQNRQNFSNDYAQNYDFLAPWLGFPYVHSIICCCHGWLDIRLPGLAAYPCAIILFMVCTC